MRLDKVLKHAVTEKLLVTVNYELGKKELGNYRIECMFPATILLEPEDTWRQKIWVPNPLSVNPSLVVYSWDDKYYHVKMYEAGSSYPPDLIWKLTFNSGDLLCLT